MQTRLVLYHLLEYAQRTHKCVSLYVRPTGLRLPDSQGIVTDDGRYVVTGYRIDDNERQSAQLPIEGWTDPFWRVLESAGWRVADKQPVARGECLWTLTLLNPPPQTEGVPTPDELLCYVEKIQPLAGERAKRALDLATGGKVRKLDPGDDGKDRWQVQGHSDSPYTVSITGGFCSCPDAANGAPRWMGAPLCKHRLAVMYIVRWEEATGKRFSPQATNGVHCPVTHSEPEEYVTLAPPATRTEGWRWAHVRGAGRLTLYSRQEYPSQDAVLPVAQTVAQAKAVPFVYQTQTQPARRQSR